jgi:hypothetical protein
MLWYNDGENVSGIYIITHGLRTMKKLFCYLSLLILPLMIVLTTLYLNKARGPYWLGMNYDPAYMYLLNSLNVARMKNVGHIDNPGTPLQVAGAVVMRIVHFISNHPKDDLQAHVLKNPEIYLAIMNKVFLGLNTLMLIIMGIVTFWITKDVMISLILQSSPFFSGSTLIYG